jgi:circadian clock protein KaiB
VNTEGCDPEALARTLLERREQVYILRLYVGGASPKSIEAIRNIKTICEQYLAGKYELSVVDVYQQPQRALGEQVVAAPMLVKHLPLPSRRLIGNLSNAKKVLHVLGVITAEYDVAGHG